MDGLRGNGGVTLISGSGIQAGNSVTLVSGARSWRIAIKNSKESAQNKLVIEVKSGTRWIPAQEFVVVDDY